MSAVDWEAILTSGHGFLMSIKNPASGTNLRGRSVLVTSRCCVFRSSDDLHVDLQVEKLSRTSKKQKWFTIQHAKPTFYYRVEVLTSVLSRKDWGVERSDSFREYEASVTICTVAFALHVSVWSGSLLLCRTSQQPRRKTNSRPATELSRNPLFAFMSMPGVASVPPATSPFRVYKMTKLRLHKLERKSLRLQKQQINCFH